MLLGATANLGNTKIVDENTFLSLSHMKVPRGDWNPSVLAVVPGFKKHIVEPEHINDGRAQL